MSAHLDLVAWLAEPRPLDIAWVSPAVSSTLHYKPDRHALNGCGCIFCFGGVAHNEDLGQL